MSATPTDGTQADGAGLRLMVNSSPRSGNTWLRCLLAGLYGLEQIAAHRPAQVDWSALPRRCVIQIHWPPTAPLLAQVERNGVRPVVLARHPLDALISTLNYAFHTHQDGHCPGGGACNECVLVGETPRSPAFLDYAGGPSGRLILSYSADWWDRPGMLRVRYEELVAAPESTLARLVAAIGRPPARPIAEVVAETAMGRLRPRRDVWHSHYWQGRPGLWRSLLPAEEARRIAAGNPRPFAALGYLCDPDEALAPADADLNWLRLQLDSARGDLALERAKHRQARGELAEMQAHRDGALRALWEEQQAHAATRSTLEATRAHVERSYQALLVERHAAATARAERDALLARPAEPGSPALGLARRLWGRWAAPRSATPGWLAGPHRIAARRRARLQSPPER